MDKNKECSLYGTRECALLNMQDCKECYISQLGEAEKEAARVDLERILEQISPEELSPLYASEKCLFCKADEANLTQCYALFDMAKQDEVGMKQGFSKKLPNALKKNHGLILPMQMCCCKKCRTRYRLIEYIPMVFGVVMAAAGLVVSTNTTVHKALFEVGAWVPFALFAGFILIGVIGGAVIRRFMAKSFSKKTIMNVNENPVVKGLWENGWEQLQKPKGGISTVFFSKERRSSGIYSATDSGIETAVEDELSEDETPAENE